MKEKRLFPRAVALDAAREVVQHLREVAESDTLRVVGSLRRKRPMVHDVDLVLIPTTCKLTDLLGQPIRADLLALKLGGMYDIDIISPPPEKCEGESIRRVIHTRTGVPVDIFSATRANYWSVVICRTGSAEHNRHMINRAKEKGMTWNPQRGFVDAAGHDFAPITSEEDFYTRLQLPYLAPECRDVLPAWAQDWRIKGEA